MPKVGAELYSAPEAWFEGDNGCPMDIWSFGTIIFELLTLELFTPGKSSGQGCFRLEQVGLPRRGGVAYLGATPAVHGDGRGASPLRRGWSLIAFVGSVRGLCATAGPVGSCHCSIDVAPSSKDYREGVVGELAPA